MRCQRMHVKRGNFEKKKNKFCENSKTLQKNDEFGEDRESFENSSKVSRKFKEMAKGVP